MNHFRITRVFERPAILFACLRYHLAGKLSDFGESKAERGRRVRIPRRPWPCPLNFPLLLLLGSLAPVLPGRAEEAHLHAEAVPVVMGHFEGISAVDDGEVMAVESASDLPAEPESAPETLLNAPSEEIMPKPSVDLTKGLSQAFRYFRNASFAQAESSLNSVVSQWPEVGWPNGVDATRFARALPLEGRVFTDLSTRVPETVAARWVLDWYRWDSGLRSVALDRRGGDDLRQAYRDRLSELLSMLEKQFEATSAGAGTGAYPQLWAELHASLGRSYQYAGHYRGRDSGSGSNSTLRALEWWAQQPESDFTRSSFLRLLSESLGLDSVESALAEVPILRGEMVRYVEDGLRLNPSAGERSVLLLSLAQFRQRLGALEAVRSRELLEEAVRSSAGTAFQWTAKLGLARYFIDYGQPSWDEEGLLRFQPESQSALALCEEILSGELRNSAVWSAASRLKERLLGQRVELMAHQAVGGLAWPSGVPFETEISFRNAAPLTVTLARLDAAKVIWPKTVWGSDLSAQTAAVSEVVQTWVFSATDFPPLQEHQATLTAGILPTGLYFLESTDGTGKQQRAIFTVTATRLSVFSDDLGLRFWLTDAATGAGQPGEVLVWQGSDNSRSPWRVAVGQDGLGFLPWGDDLPEGSVSWRAVGVGEGGPAVVSGTKWHRGSDTALRFFVFTDRPIYRPGQTVHWRSFVRQPTETGWQVPGSEETPITYEIESSDWMVLAEGELSLSEYGSAGGTFVLPEDIDLGMATVTFSWDDDSAESELFRVEEYRRPEFEVSVKAALGDDPAGRGIRPGDRVPVVVSASYLSGGPLVDAAVELVITRESWFFQPKRGARDFDDLDDSRGDLRGFPGRGEEVDEQAEPVRLGGRTDLNGEAHFTIDVPWQAGGDFQFSLRAEVTSAEGVVLGGAGSVVVAEQPYFAEVVPDRLIVQQREGVSVSVFTARPTGDSISVAGDLVLYQINYEELWIGPFSEEIDGATLRQRAAREGWAGRPGAWGQWRRLWQRAVRTEIGRQAVVTSAASGEARATFAASQPGRYEVVWQSRDSDGRPIRASAGLWVLGRRTEGLAGGGDFAIVLPGVAAEVGETLPVLVTAPVPVGEVLLMVETDRFREVHRLALEDGVGRMEFTVGESWAPNVTFHALMVGAGAEYRTQLGLRVPPSRHALDLELNLPESAAPGAEVVMTVSATAPGGVADSSDLAEVSVTLYDAGLAQLQRPLAGDPLEVFFELRPAGWLDVTISSAPVMPKAEKLALSEGLEPAAAPSAGGLMRSRGGDLLQEEGPSGAEMVFESVGLADMADARGYAEPAADVAGGPIITVRSDFRELAFWEPARVVPLDGAPVAFPVKLPDDTTRWVARAWAAGQSANFGHAEASILSRLPLIVRLGLPRFLIAGDTVEIRGSVQNQQVFPVEVKTQFDLTGPIALLDEAGGHGAVETVEAGGSIARRLRLEATEAGMASVGFSAVEGAVGDARLQPLVVRPHGLAVVESLQGQSSGPGLSMEWVLPKFDPATFSGEISVTPQPLTALAEALPSLLALPDQLTEQRVSRYVPAVVLHGALSGSGLTEAEAEAVIAARLPEELAADSRSQWSDFIGGARQSVLEAQLPGGGFSWWVGSDWASPLMSAYGLWGLAEARRYDPEVPLEALRRGRDYLQAELDRQGDADTQAWMLFALATVGRAMVTEPLSESIEWLLRSTVEPTELEARVLASLWRQREKLNDSARATLALAAVRFGYGDESAILIENLAGNAQRGELRAASRLHSRRVDGEGSPAIPPVLPGTGGGEAAGRGDGAGIPTAHWGQTDQWYRWSQGAVETTALAVTALREGAPGHPLQDLGVRWLLANREGLRWRNSRESALVVTLLAGNLAASRDALAYPWEATVSVGGEPVGTVRAETPGHLWRLRPLGLAAGVVQPGSQAVSVAVSGGEGLVFLAAQANFFTTEKPIAAAGRQVAVTRAWHRLRPQPSLLRGAPLVPEALPEGAVVEEGSLISSTVRFSLEQAGEHLVLIDPKPAGCEPLVARSGQRVALREVLPVIPRIGDPRVVAEAVAEGGEPGLPRAGQTRYGQTRYGFEEWRDGERRIYIEELPLGTWEVVTYWRAELAGEFSVLPAQVRALYVAPFQGHSWESTLQVGAGDLP